MKKVLLSLAMFMGIISMNAQTPVGTVVSNFTLTDINGNTHDLFSYLDAGKTVVIDVSATWCGPCWNYHGTGALNDFYLAHGPSGTNDAIALFIEGDVTTNDADLHGTGTNTQGDWVTGESLPIIDLATAASFTNSGLVIPYYPVMYVICPNRIVIQSGVAGAIGTTAMLESYMGTCPPPASMPVDPAFLGYTGTTTSCSTFDLGVTLQNNGLTPLTSCTISVNGIPSPISYDWTGNLATYATANVSLGTVTLAASATAVITITSTDGDAANSTYTQTLNFIDATQTTALPSTTNFTVSGFPYPNWQNLNPDGASGWGVVATATQGDAMFIDTYNYDVVGQEDDIITAPYSLAGATSPSLTFKYANCAYNLTQYFDKMRISVSTSCDGPWTEVWYKEGAALMTTAAVSTSGFTNPTAAQWKSQCVDLTQFAGSSALFVKFTNVNNYGNNIFLDDIAVQNSSCADLGMNIEESALINAGLNAYPNPTNNNTNVNFMVGTSSEVSMNVINLLGETVFAKDFGTLAAGNYNEVVNFANLSSGLYLVNVNINGKVSTIRLTVSK